MSSDLTSLLIDHVIDAQERHPSLHLRTYGSHEYEIVGRIGFRGDCRGLIVEGDYELTMLVPTTYPDRPPRVYDFKHQIPDEFEHVDLPARRLCLGAPVEVNLVFSQGRSLSHFLERQVEPYLFSASCAALLGTSPFPELAHGGKGLQEYYARKLSCSERCVEDLVGMLARTETPWDTDCPCESGESVRHCHGPRIEALRPHQTPAEFKEELHLLRSLAPRQPAANMRNTYRTQVTSE